MTCEAAKKKKSVHVVITSYLRLDGLTQFINLFFSPFFKEKNVKKEFTPQVLRDQNTLAHIPPSDVSVRHAVGGPGQANLCLKETKTIVNNIFYCIIYNF